MTVKYSCLVLCSLLFISLTDIKSAKAQVNSPDTVAGIPVNYNEADVGSYILPDPLLLSNGQKVRNAEMWYKQRRPQILALFEQFQYGHTPEDYADVSFNIFEKGTPAFDGTAIRKQITISFSSDENGPEMDLLIYIPINATKPVPVLFTLGFLPNSSRVDDQEIKRGKMWNRQQERVLAPENSEFGDFNAQLQMLLSHGVGVAMVYYGDIEPDFKEGIQKNGVRNLYLKPGQTKPAPEEWGAISAWAWGLSRAMDYIETDEDINSNQVALMGVSRLGKTVLWAAARDQRFSMVISCCSGAGGAAISRRNYGETIAHLTADSRYPYQFAANLGMFSDYIDHLPVDSNLLLSLIAPRPVLLQTGDQDYWLDPKGEFLAAVAAEPVYQLLGKQGLGTDQLPPVEQPILNTIGYYMHRGGHGPLISDWDIYLEFLKKHFKTDN